MPKVALSAFGLVLELNAPMAIVGPIVAALGHCSRPVATEQTDIRAAVRRGVDGQFEGHVGGETFSSESTAALVVELPRRIEAVLAENCPTHVFVHAGVVCLGGRVVVLPGGSRAGKSTAVEALVRAGATYWSDEFAPVDLDGRVVPFPRPLNRRVGERTELVTLPGPTEHSPRPVKRVVLARYEPGSRWAPAPLSRGEALLRLIEHTVPVRQRPAQALGALDRLLEAATVEAGLRGDADEFAAALAAAV